jgi:hypothetical protein
MEWHRINPNSECAPTKPHQLKTGYKFDCIVQEVRPRWLVMQVCVRCKGYYCEGFRFTKPENSAKV